MDSPPLSPRSSTSSSPPPPLERALSDDESPQERTLASRLAPWLRCFATCATRWERLPTHAHRLGVVVDLRADVTDEMIDEEDEFENLLQLREAIDLVQLALVVEPAALQSLLWKKNEWDDDTHATKDEDAIASLLRAGGARSELRLQFEYIGIKTRLLGPQLVTHFMHHLGQTLSTNGEYRELRNGLLQRLKADEHDFERVQRVSVPIVLDIDSDELENISLLDADDFFVYLTAFSNAVVEHQRDHPVMRWRLDAEHVPLTVECIELKLQRFCITHRVAQAAKAFMRAGVPVKVKQLNLDPRLISCAEQDVRDFVCALTAGASDLRMLTGLDPNEEYDSIDEDDQDRRDTIRIIMETIADAGGIHELDLGGLLTLCDAPPNRQIVWQSLFQRVLLADSPPDTLSLGESMLVEEDCDFIREEVRHWRDQRPEKKRFVENLCLYLSTTDIEHVEPILAAFDDTKRVYLSNRNGANIPPPVLRRILSYPSLKRLTIENLMLQSMDVFNPDLDDDIVVNKPLLEELSLEGLILADRSSMARFMHSLRWDIERSSSLSKSLRRFHVTQNSFGRSEFYVADEEALEALVQVLETNRVLQDVKMVVDFSMSFVHGFEKQIKHHRSRIPIPASTTKRQSEIVKARNLAFLSVIRASEQNTSSARSLVDAAAVSRIFDFSAPHVWRQAALTPWED